jgi:hypothetical protein
MDTDYVFDEGLFCGGDNEILIRGDLLVSGNLTVASATLSGKTYFHKGASYGSRLVVPRLSTTGPQS